MRWSRTSREQWWLIGLSALSLLVIVLVVLTVPWHMDEFVQYHVLACTQPSQQLNVYRDACFAYPTRLGGWTFQRSFPYIGITSSVLLWPFFKVMNAMLAHYVAGVVSLLVVVLGIASSLKLPRQALPALPLFFPLTFAVLRGGGPVRVGLMVLAWTPVIVRRFATGNRWPAKAAWAAALIALWVVATEDKPFFVYMMPGIVLWSLAGLGAFGELPRRPVRWMAVLGLLAVAGGSALALLLLTQVEGGSYLTHLIERSQSVPGARARDLVRRPILFTLDWPYYAHRVSVYEPSGDTPCAQLWRPLAGVMPLGSTWQALVALSLSLFVVAGLAVAHSWSFLRLGWHRAREVRVTAVLLLGAAVVLGGATTLAGGWAAHHFIYMQIPLLGILALAASGRRHGLLLLGTAFAVAAIVSLAAIWLVPRPPRSSPEIPVVFQAALRAADRNTVINCASWGCYYPYSLMNEDDVPVVFAATPRHAGRLAADMRGQGRHILHLCFECNAQSVQQLYPTSGAAEVRTGTSVWKLFRVNPAGPAVAP